MRFFSMLNKYIYKIINTSLLLYTLINDVINIIIIYLLCFRKNLIQKYIYLFVKQIPILLTKGDEKYSILI